MEHKVYRHGLEHAVANGEVATYRDSNDRNEACARAIEGAIQESNHALYRYDLHTASRKVVAEYGTERVVWVLSATLQELAHDGRFSDDNKNWAKAVPIPQDRKVDLCEYAVATHPAILDGFVRVARKMFVEQEHGSSRETRADRSDR